MRESDELTQLELWKRLKDSRKVNAENLRHISRIPSLMTGFAAVDASMALINQVRLSSPDELSINIIVKLFIRSFNSFVAASDMMISGLYQSSWMLMRDILETSYLIDDFIRDPARVSMWVTEWEDGVALRDSDFTPIAVRCRLDALDGVKDMRRAERYRYFCKYGAHPSAEGLTMLYPAGRDAQMGPFIDDHLLSHSITELTKLALDVGDLASSFASTLASPVGNTQIEEVVARMSKLKSEVTEELRRATGE